MLHDPLAPARAVDRSATPSRQPPLRLPDSATLGRMLWLLEQMLAQGERASIDYERMAPFSRGTYFRTRNACIRFGLVTAIGSGRVIRPEPSRIRVFVGLALPRLAALAAS